MANIQERKTKNGEVHYRVQINIKGHPPVRETFRSKTKAKRWAERVEADIRDGHYFWVAEAKNHTLKELIDCYSKDFLPDRQRSRREHILAWWKKELGCYSLDKVTPPLIVKCRTKLTDEILFTGKKRAPATVLKYLITLSHLFTIAKTEYNWIERNPLASVSKPKVNNARTRFLLPEEKDRLLVACKEGSCNCLFTVVVLALGTGLRKGELLGLQWANVDLKTGKIFIERTKNGTARTIWLKGFVLEALRIYAKQVLICSPFVFPSHDGKRGLDIRLPFSNAVKKAGLKDFTLHSCRHSFGSYLAAQKASDMEIRELMGHKSIAMSRRYVHAVEDHHASLVESLTDAMFGQEAK